MGAEEVKPKRRRKRKEPEAPVVQTMSFSITGDFITDQVRDFWEERRFVSALRVLECLPGMTLDQQRELIEGRAKLTGVNSLELEPDAWTPPDGYCSFLDALRDGENHTQLDEYREDEAHTLLREVAIAHLSWSNGEMAEEASRKLRRAKSLLGEDEALEVLDRYKDEIREDEIEDERPPAATFQQMFTYSDEATPRRDPLQEVYEQARNRMMINAAVSGIDPDSIPTVEAMMHRGDNITPVLCPDMTSASGWLLPDGKYYGCGSMEHIGLAEALLAENHPTSIGQFGAEAVAESYGWVKISRSMMGLHVYCMKKVTKRQLDKLWDYAQVHNRDYEDMLELLDQ